MKKNRQILVLAALLFGFLCFPADKVLAASNVVEVPLTVKQNFEENSNEKGIDLTGTYEFRALDIGIPMPGDSDNDRHVFVLDGNNAEKMISLQFQHGGVYRYHLVQTSKDTAPKQVQLQALISKKTVLTFLKLPDLLLHHARKCIRLLLKKLCRSCLLRG